MYQTPMVHCTSLPRLNSPTRARFEVVSFVRAAIELMYVVVSSDLLVDFFVDCECDSSSSWAQWSIETSNTVHILPIFRLLLLPDPKDVVAWHFRVLRALERRETHHLPEQSILVIFAFNIILVTIGRRLLDLHDIWLSFGLFGGGGFLVINFSLFTVGWSVALYPRSPGRRSGADRCAGAVMNWRARA